MRIEDLEYFSQICRFGSISKAAEANYMLRQTMSSIVNSLENELGVPLLDRSNSGCRPTKQGAKVLEQTKIILDAYRSMLQLKANEEAISGEVLIGLPNSFNKKMISSIFLECIQTYPHMHIVPTISRPGHSENLIDLLCNKEIRLLYIILAANKIYDCYQRFSKYYQMDIFKEEDISFIIHKSHYLANYPAITPDLLKEQTLIFTFDDTYMRKIFENICGGTIFAPDFNSAFYLLTTGAYGFPMPQSVLLDYDRNNYVSLPFSWDISDQHQYVLLYPKEKYINNVESAFVKIFKKHAHLFYGVQ